MYLSQVSNSDVHEEPDTRTGIPAQFQLSWSALSLNISTLMIVVAQLHQELLYHQRGI